MILMRRLLLLVYLLSFLLFPLFVMGLASQRLANIPLRMAFFIILALGGSWLFRRLWPQFAWGAALAFTCLGYGVIYKLASFIPDVSTYPFSLNWSEASRYYYASLWFSKTIYGISTPPSVLHPSRYLLQSLPFLIPNTPILVHRLWQVILWIGTAALTSWLLVRRVKTDRRNWPALILLGVLFWAFLFLFQGPIYYHLLVMVILILWGFDYQHFWRSMLLVLAASLWAGISRVNWLPVPGMLAASLYLLEVKKGEKSIWRYMLPPTAWVIAGTMVGYASQVAYQAWSGNPAGWFGSSFTSDLLWYRLLPNQTFPMGILPSAILVTIPILGLMLLQLWNHWRKYQPIRLLGLAAMLFVLFAGGVVVSVKIGGGSNLHNLDAYLALLLVIGAITLLGGFKADQLNPSEALDPGIFTPPANDWVKAGRAVLLAGALIFPLYFTLSVGGALPKWDTVAAQNALQVIDSATQQVTSKGGEVLFINQRHLLTFDFIKGVNLVPEDELVFLMEMAMSDNASYLDAFHADLSRQRFALIIAEPLTDQLQGKSHSFGEENDAWVERVSEPILCYYQASTILDTVGVVLYTPRPDPCE